MKYSKIMAIIKENHLDVSDLLRQRDGNGGETVNRHGGLIVLTYALQLHNYDIPFRARMGFNRCNVAPGKWVRCPIPSTAVTNDTLNMTRDATVAIYMALILDKDWSRFWSLLWRQFARLGFYSSFRDKLYGGNGKFEKWLIKTTGYKIPDPPSVLCPNILIRGAYQFLPKWLRWMTVPFIYMADLWLIGAYVIERHKAEKYPLPRVWQYDMRDKDGDPNFHTSDLVHLCNYMVFNSLVRDTIFMQDLREAFMEHHELKERLAFVYRPASGGMPFTELIFDALRRDK